MTRTSTTAPHSGKTGDAINSGAAQLGFNPLHPSMELPPEQLIRLLSLEAKKSPAHNPAAESSPVTANEQPQQPPPAAAEPLLQRTPPSVQQPREQQEPVRGRSIPVAALIGGLLIMALVTAYVLFGRSATSNEPPPASRVNPPPAVTPATAANPRPQTPSSSGQPRGEATPVSNRKTAAAPQLNLPSPAAIADELNRLKSEAMRRFEQHTLNADPLADETSLPVDASTEAKPPVTPYPEDPQQISASIQPQPAPQSVDDGLE